jgi:hypothetical protein
MHCAALYTQAEVHQQDASSREASQSVHQARSEAEVAALRQRLADAEAIVVGGA